MVGYLLLSVIWVPFVAMFLADGWTVWEQVFEAMVCSYCSAHLWWFYIKPINALKAQLRAKGGS